MPKVAIVTLGCPKNTVSSRNMERVLTQGGADVTAEPAAADIILVNSCGFIGPAKEESIEATLEALSLKSNGDGPQVFLTGCLAERNKSELSSALPEIDGVLDFADIGPFLSSLGGDAKVSPETIPQPVGASAYLQIADGCSNGCSFCAIPSIKGPYRSRSRRDIGEEARALVAGGARELVLIAQDTGRYGQDDQGRQMIVPLLRDLQAIDDLRWLRVMYLNPATITNDLIADISTMEKLCLYVDLPLQHASGSVLRRMRRPGDRKVYQALIKRLRESLPGLWLRTEFIVGFPGETEDDFKVLCDFVAEASPDYVGVFTYSREEGTPAYDLTPPVPTEVANCRAQALRELSDEIALPRKAGLVGETLEVLIENKTGEGKWQGRFQGQAPEVDGEVHFEAPLTSPAPGDFARIKITDSCGYDLAGHAVP